MHFPLSKVAARAGLELVIQRLRNWQFNQLFILYLVDKNDWSIKRIRDCNIKQYNVLKMARKPGGEENTFLEGEVTEAYIPFPSSEAEASEKVIVEVIVLVQSELGGKYDFFLIKIKVTIKSSNSHLGLSRC